MIHRINQHYKNDFLHTVLCEIIVSNDLTGCYMPKISLTAGKPGGYIRCFARFGTICSI